MQRIVPFLLIVAILSTGCPRPEPEVRKVEIGLYTPYFEFPDFLNGKVKEVVERNYLAVEQFRMPEDTLMWSARFTTDKNGNFQEWEYLNPGNEPAGKYIFTVNREGRRTGFKYYDGEGEMIFEQEYTCNGMGNL